MKPLIVVGWDMKHLLVADEKVLRVYKILWKDVEFVESEQVIQVPIVKIDNHSKITTKPRERKSLFDTGKKPDKKPKDN